jgi:hypothetical protein
VDSVQPVLTLLVSHVMSYLFSSPFNKMRKTEKVATDEEKLVVLFINTDDRWDGLKFERDRIVNARGSISLL